MKDSVKALLVEIRLAKGADRRFDAALGQLESALDHRSEEADGRRLVHQLALALTGSLIVRYAPAVVADAFCASRFSPLAPFCFGGLPSSCDLGAIVKRATPPS